MNRFVLLFLVAAPLSVFALADFGGWVTNVPGTHGGQVFADSSPVFPPEGVFAFWDSLSGRCLNGVQEVDLTSPKEGLQSPPVLLQFIGSYTYSAGPAKLVGQAVIGKYLPAMVCMMNFVVWFECGPSLCPDVNPLPFFAAPLIIWNGSSVK